MRSWGGERSGEAATLPAAYVWPKRLPSHSSSAASVSGSPIGGGVGGACVGSGLLPTGLYPLLPWGSNCCGVSATAGVSVSGCEGYLNEVEELYIIHTYVDPTGLFQRALKSSGA